MKPKSGGFLIGLFITASLALNAQTSGTVVGDDCITFDSCPGDQTVCADTYKDGVLGKYVNWQNPVVSQTCTGNGNTGNFQMLFELNEQLLTEECWDFNFISRVGGNGGHIKLFSGNDEEEPKLDRSFIVTPYLMLNDNSETSFEVNYSAPNGQEDYTYTIQLFLVDQNGNEIPSGGPVQVTKDQDVYTFNTNNPNDEPGIYRLKYLFVHTGDTPNNANTGDTLIAVDGMLYDNGCSGGIDFTVTAPQQGFYPVGIHDLEYVATYISPSGVIQKKTCSFTIHVTGLDLQIDSSSDLSCGSVDDGSISASVKGVNLTGTPPYQFSIDGMNFQDTGDFGNLEAGTYTVTVQDATGCTDSETVVISSKDAPTADAGTTGELTCSVQTLTLNGTASGQGTLSYGWTTTDGTIDSGADTATPVISAPGTYTLTVTDADNGCSATDTVVITQDISIPTAEAGNTNELTCSVQTLTLGGSASGQGTLSYGWTTTDGTIDSDANTATPVISAPGTYTLTVTDADNGCSATDTVVITENITQPTAEAGNTEELTCSVQTLTLNGTASGQGTLSYGWTTTDGTIDSGADTATPVVSAPGTYTLTVTDGENGCSATDTVVITENITKPTAEAGTTDELTCAAQTLTLNGTGSGQGALSYGWTTTDGNIDSGANTATPVISAPGTYTLTVTDTANGCSETDNVVITQNIAPATATITGNETLTCEITSVTLDASNSAADGNFTYMWSNGSTSSTITVSEAGPYSVTITGENGCEDIASVTVEEDAKTSQAVITGNDILTCTTSSVTLDASSSTASGEISYLWSTGSADASVTVTEPGLYSVTITGENGCKDTASVTVVENTTPAVATITGNENLTCEVTAVTLDASTSTADGTYTYLWSTGSTDASITITEPGTYFVTILGENGCQDETSVTIEAFQDNPAIPELAGTPAQPTCDDPMGSFDVTALEGMEYSLNGGEFSTTASFTDLSTGTYSVVAKNEYGCISEPLNVSIDAQPEKPAAPIVHVTVHPSCGETTGSFGICCDTGMEYSIDGTNFQQDPIFLDLAPGNYEVVARNAVGCISEPTPVTINPAPETPEAPEIASIEQPSCEVPTGSFTVNAEAGLEYSIDGTNYQSDGTFEGLNPDTYEVTAKNSDGCISEATAVTIEPQPETPAAPIVHVTVHPSCGETTGSFGICCDTGMEYSIDGTNFQLDPIFLNLAPGNYEVVARNADGCISEPTPVTINPAPETPEAPQIASVEQPSCEVPTGSFTVNVEAGLEYSIDGTNYQPDGTFEGLNPDTYEVTAKNSEGCISQVTAVTIEPQPETPAAPQIASTQQPSCDNPAGSFTVTAEAGVEYSINGTDFSGTGAFTGLTPGETYEVIARNADGCISEPTSISINEQPATPAAPVVEQLLQPTCEEPTGMVVLSFIEGVSYSMTDADGNTITDTDEDGIFDALSSGEYSVVAQNEDGCVSEPIEVTVNAQPVAPAVPEVSATQPTCAAPTGSIEITAVQGMEYRLNDGEFSNTTSFTDLDPATYTLTARNADGCESESITVTIAQPEAAIIDTAVAKRLCIEDSPYNLKDMLLGEYDQSGSWEDPANTGALENGIVDPSLLDLGNYTFNYVIEGECPSTTPVEIIIHDECVVLACGIEDVKESISKAVTPNGDGINDFFTIGLELNCGFIYNVQIFNRWGNKVFESNNYQNNWDGTSRSSLTGDQLPAGTYYYIVQIEGLEPIQGYIYLGTK